MGLIVLMGHMPPQILWIPGGVVGGVVDFCSLDLMDTCPIVKFGVSSH